MPILIEHYINTIDLPINKDTAMTATLPPPEIAFTDDRVGAVENAGVEYLPKTPATPGRATWARSSSART